MTCKHCTHYTFTNRFCTLQRKQMAAWGECAAGEPRKVKTDDQQ